MPRASLGAAGPTTDTSGVSCATAWRARVLGLGVVLGLGLGLVAVASCGGRAAPSNTRRTEPGVALSLYSTYGVVDERRWVDVTGSRILLANIDPGASLASLVIEPLDPALRIGPCTRDRLPGPAPRAQELSAEEQARLAQLRDDRRRSRMHGPGEPTAAARPSSSRSESRLAPARFAPVIACEVSGAQGRQLIRLVYVSTTLTYRVQHDVEVTSPGRATIDTRYAIATPAWQERAQVTLFDGTPGGAQPPRELARGELVLDGGTGVLVVPTHDAVAHVRRIFTAGVAAESPERAEAELWAPRPPGNAVWATLELRGIRLAPGRARVHVVLPDEGERWVDTIVDAATDSVTDAAAPDATATAAPDGDGARATFRLPLWFDDTLRVARQHAVIARDARRRVEQLAFVVTSTGEVPREVVVEERLGPARRRVVERAWPRMPGGAGDVVRLRIGVKPGRLERAGYTVVYEL